MPRLQAPHALLILIGSTLLLLGCEMETRVVSESAWIERFRTSEWATQSSNSSSGSSSSVTRSSRGYAIQLGQFSGADANQRVYRLVGAARDQAGLANLWTTTSSGVTTLYAGRFRDPKGSEAKTLLKQVRGTKIKGEKVFEDAEVVALTRDEGDALDPNDLRSLKGKGLYTLQIGYYDGNYGPDFRRAAETAVKVLREQSEEAYYYHGPHRSMILVNAWTYAEAFTRRGVVDRYSSIVLAAQKKHPHNIPNGRSFTKKDDPEYVKSQHSFLVPIR